MDTIDLTGNVPFDYAFLLVLFSYFTGAFFGIAITAFKRFFR